MGITKTDKFNDSQNELALYAKAFGHPARIAILEYLFKQKKCVCGEIVNEIGLAQATISQHLKELKYIEIIQGNIEGNKICYCINTEKWNEINRKLNSFFNQNQSNEFTCC